MIKKVWKGLTGKRLILWITVFLSFCAFLILWGASSVMIQSLDSQQMAKRWSEDKDWAQISCFFSANTSYTPDIFEEKEHHLENMLIEEAIVLEAENPGARLWVGAYSASGQITVASDRGNVTSDAIGIGGDFFLFHPLKLLYGSYFSGNDLMQDYCILDEEAAWKLFGSNDIAGQYVTISGIPHVVIGVIERENGRMAEAAGLDSSVIYVSYDSLNKYGTHSGINHYEIIMPNPVKGYALGKMQELYGSNETEVEIIDNTSRFDLLNRIKLIGEFGTRSMNGKAIIYPYWENIARGYEDILAVLTIFMLVFLSYPVIIIVVGTIYWWKHRTWRIKSLWKRIRGGRRL